jgi:hypothetical protein
MSSVPLSNSPRPTLAEMREQLRKHPMSSPHIRDFSIHLLRADIEHLAGILKGKGYQDVDVNYHVGTREPQSSEVHIWLMVKGTGLPDTFGCSYKFFRGETMFEDALRWAADLELHPSLACAPWFSMDAYGDKVPS